MKRNLPLILNIIANIIPLIGVLFWGWSTVTLLFVYWQEAVVTGFYNIPKMLLASLTGKLSDQQRREMVSKIEADTNKPISDADKKTAIAVITGEPNLRVMLAKLPFVVFFVVHFGVFMFVYGEALRFSEKVFGETSQLSFFNSALLLFFVSHGVSFLLNYCMRKEYKNVSMSEQMFSVYKRVGILHAVILFGGVLGGILGSNVSFIIVLVGAKIVADVVLHTRSHSS